MQINKSRTVRLHRLNYVNKFKQLQQARTDYIVMRETQQRLLLFVSQTPRTTLQNVSISYLLAGSSSVRRVLEAERLEGDDPRFPPRTPDRKPVGQKNARPIKTIHATARIRQTDPSQREDQSKKIRAQGKIRAQEKI